MRISYSHLLLGYVVSWLAFRPLAQSQNRDVDMRQAQVFFEAKEYDQAKAIYQQLLQDNLPPWQVDIVMYDIGTVLLSQGHWDQAIHEFQAIPIEEQTSPLLVQRLTANKALASLLQAISLLHMIEGTPTSTGDDYNKNIFLFRETLNAIEEAEKAACRLAQAKGQESCGSLLDLKEMRLEAKRQFALLLQKYADYHVSHASIEEGIPLLISGVNAALSHLSFLESKDLDEKMKNRYLQLYLKEEKSWFPLWSALKEKLAKETKKDSKEKSEVFLKAEHHFMGALDSMKGGDFAQSLQQFNQSLASLNALMQQLFGGDLLKAILHKLLSSYQRALAQNPLQESTLFSLQEEQKQIARLLKTSTSHPLVEERDIDKTEKTLASGQQALAQSKSLQARFFIEEARHLVRKMVELLNHAPSQKNIPENILESALADGEQALLLNRLRQQMEGREQISPEIDTLLLQAQARVLVTADPFLKDAVRQQVQAFTSPLVPQQEDFRCQEKPWDDVIPLFNKGYLDAQQAKNLLADARRRSAAPLQERTLKSWKEALDKLRNFKPFPQNKPQAGGGGAGEQTKELEKQAQPQGTSLNDVLRLLQEMEQDDQSKPKLFEIPVKQEERPW
jgi:hypothetical protein